MLEEIKNNWRFAEAHWYCGECGLVSATDVQTDSADAETGICRCGKEITRTTF